MPLKRAFTLIEIITGVAVISILMLIALGGVSSFRDSSLLTKEVDDAENLIKIARSRTLASIGESSHGVYFGTSTVVLFRGMAYSSTNQTNEITNLSPLIEISNVAVPGSFVVFRRLTGEATATGTVTFRIKNNPARIKTLIIYDSGFSKIQ